MVSTTNTYAGAIDRARVALPSHVATLGATFGNPQDDAAPVVTRPGGSTE